MRTAKKLLIIMGVLIGALIALATFVARSLTSGIEINHVREVMGYITNFGVSIDSETSIMIYLIRISNNAHWILTTIAVWFALLIFLWEKQKGVEVK